MTIDDGDLCTVAEYRDYTLDTDTPNTTVLVWLARAVRQIEAYLSRTLVEDDITETLRLYWGCSGYEVRPTVTPVTVFAGGTIDPDRPWVLRITTPTYATVGTDTWSYATVAYTGGYTATTCPEDLKEAVAHVAKALGTPNPTGPVAVAGQTLTMGDATVQNPAGSVSTPIDATVPGISVKLAAYRKPAIA